MRSSIVLGLTGLFSLAAAVPQPQPSLSAADVYTSINVTDGFPKRLAQRGYDGGDECTECPPEPTCDTRWKGCLYIECNDCDCEDEDCCACIGLEKETPYVFSFPLSRY
jgi:hypothetical protein